MRQTTRDPNQRLCTLCTRNEVENEEHFLLTCPTYDTYRTELMLTYSTTCPNLVHLKTTDKFTWILTSENKAALKALGKYIWLSQELRKNKLRTNNSEPLQSDNATTSTVII